MKLSTKGRYGLRALIDLAQNSTEEPVSITSIAERQEISERYLEQLSRLAMKNGSSTFIGRVCLPFMRSIAGGYILARPMEEISVGDILRALEGSLDPVDCPGLLEEGCKSADSCVTKYVWKRINDSINRTVDEIRLDQLVKGGLEDGKIDIS